MRETPENNFKNGKHSSSKHLINEKNNIKRNSKTSKKLSHSFLNFISIICIIIIIFSLYNISIWFIENKNSNSLLSDINNNVNIIENSIVIEGETVTKSTYDFTNLLTMNSNTVGWIHVENTNINYPIVQYTDNNYYLNHSFDNTINSAGWVFADCNCNMQNLGYNTIIYSHNRKDKSMFGTLKNTLTPEWYLNKNNYYINFSNLSSNHIYKVFSTFVCNDTNVSPYLQTEFNSIQEFNSYITKLKNNSSYNFDTDINNTDKIITLYTCYGLNNQRLIVCAKLVN